MSDRPAENMDTGATRSVPRGEERHPRRIEQILRAQPLNEMRKGEVRVMKMRSEVSVDNRNR